jgi:Mn2+/Fe2+ NRAMP family transporter
MPVLDWQAARITHVAGSRFGLYWAVAIPLTVAVLISWFVWTSVMMRKQADEGKAARNTL